MDLARMSEQGIVEDRWIRGWAQICEYMGGISRSTVITMSKKYGFPLHRTPDGIPVIMMNEANRWLRSFSEISSPFRLRKLVGAALRSQYGELFGAVTQQGKRLSARLKKNGYKVEGMPGEVVRVKVASEGRV